jgi:small subunit ribosomal protein S5
MGGSGHHEADRPLSHHGRAKELADGAVRAAWSSTRRSESKDAKQQRERRGKDQKERRATDEFEERVVHLARTAKVVKGGRRFACCGRAETSRVEGWMASTKVDAIRKARAPKEGIRAPSHGTIPHEVQTKFGAGMVLLAGQPRHG